MGIGFVLNPGYFKKAYDSVMKEAGFMIFGGIMALVVGFLIVTFHNVWVKDWTVLVTIIGWMALLKGVLIFLAPKLLIDFSKAIFNKVPTQALGVCVVIMGLVFGYFGFMA